MGEQDRSIPSASHTYVLKVSGETLKYPYAINYDTRPHRGKTVQLFTKALDGHAAFTTLLHLDLSFTMVLRALRLRHPGAPDAPSVLRPKPINLPPSGFEDQTSKPAMFDVDAYPASTRLRCLQVFHAPAARVAYSNLPSPSSLT